MKNRIVNAPAQPRAPFGLIAWLEQTKIVLPLKGVECSFEVCGDVVSVEIDQIFHQTSGQPLDCIYTFPLPATAAVYRCEMHVNGRLIRAQVEERGRARELAREKKAAGHRTALVEMERDNLFTLSLGNVQPDDLVVIRFAYFQTLTCLGDWTSFHIPFCPGVRYIPGEPLLRGPRGRGVVDDTDQVPDASRISPPRMDRLHPDAARLSVAGTVKFPSDEVRDISSPSHPVLVRPAKTSFKVELAEQAAAPDCDFVLRWTEVPASEVKPRGWVTRTGQGTYALLRLRAPLHAPVAEDYAQDIYFLIDRSGSMAGLKWQKAVQAFHGFLKTLGKGDRVWATFFESRVHDLAEKPLPVAELLADSSVRNIEALGTDGGTELLPALEHVLEKINTHSPVRPAALLLITDGQVGNEAAVLTRLSKRLDLKVHVFGIDVALNDGFLQKLAAQNQGSSCLMAPQDDIAGAVARLGDRLRRPVLTEIRVSDGWELPGGRIPNMHTGETISIALKANGKEKRPLALRAKLPDGTPRDYDFDLRETTAASVPLLWAKQRIEFLLARDQSTEAIRIAKESNLVCEGAAFIAWDEAEKVSISGPDREVYQPSMEVRDVVAGYLGSSSFMGDDDSPHRVLFSIKTPKTASGLFGRFLRRRGSPKKQGTLSVDVVQRELLEQTFFQTPAGLDLANYLIGWATGEPSESPSRLEQLEQLALFLRAAAGQPADAWLGLVRFWIENHLKHKQRAEAIACLERLEVEARLHTAAVKR